jgi:hypothetical protein
MTNDRINYINIGLIILSCIVAFFVPFELFLFSYGVLGPLHYLTEIGWLHKKNYYTKGKYDFVFLSVICALLFYFGFIKPTRDATLVPDLITLGLFLSLIFVFVKDWLYRGVLTVLSLLVIGVLNNFGDYYMWVGIFLPTVIHVFLFTWLFMLYGVLKEKSTSGFLSVVVMLACAISFFVITPEGLNHTVNEYVKGSYQMFNLLNFYIINLFHLDNLKDVSQIFDTNAGFVVMRFIAFSYTYHYLNWFSKTSVIKWHQVPKKNLILTLSIWAVSVALYIYDYNVGLHALFFLSFLHVFLEFPLNFVSITGIGKELSAFAKQR